MSVLDPDEPIEAVMVEEPPIEVPSLATPISNAVKAICGHCRRPGIELDRGWVHLDPRIDHPSNPAWCVFEAYEEPAVRWGWLNDGKRSEFTVSDGRGSKGRSGGGVSA